MLIATRTSVYRLEDDGSCPPSLAFEGGGIRRVAEGSRVGIVALANGDVVLLQGEGLRRVASGIAEPIESLMLLHESPIELLIGTEAPHLYYLTEDGEPARRNASFAALPVRPRWYTPWGGPAALRSLARTNDGWVYADIHVGSIMRSEDRGTTWAPVTPGLHEDVHQVNTSPASDEIVYANTFLAVYLSQDRGRTWHHRATDLGQRYGRAVVVHPKWPEVALATVSDGPSGTDVHGQLYRTEDAGLTWALAEGEFPRSTVRNIDTYHLAFSPDGTAWACVDRALYVSGDSGASWRRFWEAPERIAGIACRR
ncbi:MAG: hypothetical protein HPY83_03635 [Anaerolineae bacterium]|nr:hypothetical protein [Anaerolineae bacterium]